MSDFLENAIINHILRNQTFTPSTAVYLALFTATPTDSTAGTEVTGGSYARQSVTLSASTTGSSANTNAISFTSMPAVTVVAAALMDASTAGNVLLYNAVTSTPVTAGQNYTVAIGALTITLD